MENENSKGLLEKTKEAVANAVSRVTHSELAGTLATGAHHALEKLEEMAPAAIAGPVHAVAEAAAGLLPDAPAAHASGTAAASEAKAPAAKAEIAAPAKPESVSAKKAAPAAAAKVARFDRAAPKMAASAPAPATHVFKVKRGQKH